MRSTNDRSGFVLALVLLVGAGSAFAQGPLRGTFEGRAQGTLKLLRGIPKVRMTSRVRMNILEKDGSVTIRSTTVETSIGKRDVQGKHLGGTAIETTSTGKIISDSTVAGERRVRVLFDGPDNAAATQRSMDAASRAGGQAKSSFTVARSRQILELVQRRDGSLHIVESSQVTRGRTQGLLNRLLLKRTITSESTYDLSPAAPR